MKSKMMYSKQYMLTTMYHSVHLSKLYKSANAILRGEGIVLNISFPWEIKKGYIQMN